MPKRKHVQHPNRGTGNGPTAEIKNRLQEIDSGVRQLLSDFSSMKQQLDDSREKTETEYRKMILSFIEVADSFENVFRSINPKLDEADPQTRKWVSNFKTIYKMLLRALDMWDAVPVETLVGEKANPNWHNVVEVEKNPERENETIMEEIKKGYLWKGKLLRAAEVKAISNL